ncbi:uncharacterized protein [Eurosta solidaginis]|uniref:uncharacterized protein n=1 Tax=Eurosta solidaginis TaxID=178769 RepID=UPI0035308126
MLSSTKLEILWFLLLQLLIATTSVQCVELQQREIQNNTTTVAAEMAVTSATPATLTPATATTTAKATLNIRGNLMQIGGMQNLSKKETLEKNVKVIFPSHDNSDEETKFDIYGLKTTPKPKDQTQIVNTMKTTDLTSLDETTTVDTILAETDNKNSTSNNATIKSLDDRLGILNLAPHCPEGHIVVNQRCRKRV